MSTALLVWRAQRRQSRRAIWVVALTVGLLGGIALASLAGARRTASTFSAYERDVRLSDLAVNTFVPDLTRVHAVARLPGVKSSATYVGLNAYPVLRGTVVNDFRYTGVFGSLDGRFFTQDRATVVAGRLPRLNNAHEIALSPRIAALFGAGVGDDVEYGFDTLDSTPLGQTSFRVVGIVRLPPVIVDENDIIEGAVLPPAATRAHLDSLVYAWQGIRLVGGVDGIDKFLHVLRSDPTVNTLPPVTQRYDETRVQAQRSIRPEAVALALFGAAAVLAALALGGLGVSRLVRRRSGDRLTLRALGLTRRQLTLAFGLDAAVAVVVGIVLALIVSFVLSPLWPVGALRDIAPNRALHADATVMVGGGGLLALSLLGVGTVAAWRAARSHDAGFARARPSVVVASASRWGVPLPGVLGAHFALDRGEAPNSLPVRATLFAGAAATLAVVAALVFGASLQGLVSNPQRYGWAWDRMLIAEAGYGNLRPTVVQPLIGREHAVTAWSLLAFGSVTIDRASIPALGLDRREGHVQPPVLTGRTVAGDREIVLGRTTLEQLGRTIGDTVRVDAGAHRAEFTIVGTATFPSIGRGGADHTSLGRGVLVTFHALAELTAPGVSCGATETALCPQALAFDIAPGADAAAVVRHISGANPDGTAGGTYEQPVTRAADIRNYDEMGSFPLALAALLATAAAIAFLVSLIGTVRARRRDLAVLRTLGLTHRQLRATLIAQTLVTVLVTVAIGIPLGIIAGRLTWIRFAQDIGVITRPTIPTFAVLAIAALVALSCSIFSLIPAAAVARTPAARTLRTE